MKYIKLIWQKKTITVFALMSAFSLSIFLYSYWLTPLVNPASKRIAVYTLIIGIVGTIIYFGIMLRVFPLFIKLAFYVKVILVFTSLVIWGSVFYLANTIVEENIYFWVLLPKQKLNIHVPESFVQQNEQNISWFTTSLGDVSFDNVTHTGWTRNNGHLLFVGASRNSFVWEGRVGEKATIVFRLSELSDKIDVSWGAQKEALDFSFEHEGEFVYNRKFHVPWYATKEFVFFLGGYQAALLFFLYSIFLAYHVHDEKNHHIKKFPEHAQKKEKKEVIKEAGIVLSLMFFTLALRVFNLEILPPYVDEYAHFLAANDILQGSELNSIYQRSLWVVTLPVALAFQLFGNELWAARFPGVLFNTFAVIPLYFFTKKINKTIAVISVFLYATSPWIIATARNTREYAFFPFYFYLLALGLIKIIEWIPEELNLKLLWLELTRKGRWLIILLSFLPIVYIKTNPYSTFRVGMSIYFAFFFVLVFRMFVSKGKNMHTRMILFAILFLVGIPIISPYLNLSLLSRSDFRGYATQILLNSPQQWYSQRTLLIPIILFIGSFVGLILFGKRNPTLVYIWSLFGASYVFFSLFFTRYFKPRYIIFMEYWFLIILAVGFYIIWLLLKRLLPPTPAKIAVVLVGMMFFSVSQTLKPMQEIENSWMGYFPVDGEAHLSVTETDSFFSNEVINDSVLIATMYNSHVSWRDEPKFKMMFAYNYRENDIEKLTKIVNGNERGYIVFDTYRQQYITIPLESFELGNTQVDFVGLFGDQYIWKWNTKEDK